MSAERCGGLVPELTEGAGKESEGKSAQQVKERYLVLAVDGDAKDKQEAGWFLSFIL